MAPLYEPLTIDTNIEYTIDPAMFPGIDDPLRSAQPQLLIHSQTTCNCHLNDSNSQFYIQVAEPDLFDLLDTVDEINQDTFLADPELSLQELSFLEDLPALDSSLDHTSDSVMFRRLCEQLEIELDRPIHQKRKRVDDNTDDDDDNDVSTLKRRRVLEDDSVTTCIDDVLLSRGL